MVIDGRCLRKNIGQYDFCKPLKNGNLIVTCKPSNQMETLQNQDYFSDDITGTSIHILASFPSPTGTQQVIYEYNIPLSVFNHELLLCLKDNRLSLSNDLKLNLLILTRKPPLLIRKRF